MTMEGKQSAVSLVEVQEVGATVAGEPHHNTTAAGGIVETGLTTAANPTGLWRRPRAAVVVQAVGATLVGVFGPTGQTIDSEAETEMAA